MKAKVRDLGFAPDNIVVGVDVFFEVGEVGYENCWIDVPNHPATASEPNPPTHKEFVPFRSLSLSFPVLVTKQQVVDAIKTKLEAFKRAHARVEQAQQFVGLEVKI